VSNPPTRHEWLMAWIEGLTRTPFTGTASITLHLDHGSITRLEVQERETTK
jgi:hypothetical protein